MSAIILAELRMIVDEYPVIKDAIQEIKGLRERNTNLILGQSALRQIISDAKGVLGRMNDGDT